MPELNAFWTKLQSFTSLGDAEKVLLNGLKVVYEHRKKNLKVFRFIHINYLHLVFLITNKSVFNKFPKIKISQKDILLKQDCGARQLNLTWFSSFKTVVVITLLNRLDQNFVDFNNEIHTDFEAIASMTEDIWQRFSSMKL